MDALALLCNLYGDGPATLRQLRAAGVDALEQVVGVPEADLARLLDLPRATAARFQREAATLRERVTPDADAAAAEGAPASDGAPVGHRHDLIARVLDTWRACDAREERAAAVEAHSPAETRVVTTTALEPFAVDGLDRVLCRALAEHGVTTLEALADADVDALARHTGLPITRLMHVRFLARRREREQTLQPRPPLPRPTSVQPMPGPGSAAALASIHMPGAPALDPRDGFKSGFASDRPRFSPSEIPFLAAEGRLAQDLERAERLRPSRAASERTVPASATIAGPFA